MATLSRTGRVSHAGKAYEITMSVEGMDELESILKNVDKGVGFRLIEQALVKAVAPVVQAGKSGSDVPMSAKKEWKTKHRNFSKSKGVHFKLRRHRPGDLRRSFGVIKAKRSKTPLVFAGPRMGLQYNPDGYYGPWVAYGARDRGGNPKKTTDFISRIWRKNEAVVMGSIKGQLIDLVDKYFAKNGIH